MDGWLIGQMDGWMDRWMVELNKAIECHKTDIHKFEIMMMKICDCEMYTYTQSLNE